MSKKINLDKNQLKELIAQGNTVDEIAEKLGCSSYTVYMRLKEHGIEANRSFRFFNCPVCGKRFYKGDTIENWTWKYNNRIVCSYSCSLGKRK